MYLTVTAGEVTTLEHELGNDTVEQGCQSIVYISSLSFLQFVARKTVAMTRGGTVTGGSSSPGIRSL